MAKACKCDRCGSYYDRYVRELPNSTESANQICFSRGFGNETGSSFGALDLCPVCMDYILSQLTMAPVPKKELITNDDIYKDMRKEYPLMYPDDWRPEGNMKIRVWVADDVFIYDYNTKKMRKVGELE